MYPPRIIPALIVLLTCLVWLPDARAREIDIEYNTSPFNALPNGGTVSFGSRNVGTTATVSLRLRNSGSTPLTYGFLPISGSSSTQFGRTFDNGAGSSGSVLAGASITFRVTFTPGTAGSKSASFNITNNDTNENPYVINLSGTGVVPNEPNIQITQSFAPVSNNDTVNFGDVSIGGIASRTFRIRNAGNQNLTNITVRLTGGAEWSFDGTVPVSLAPNAFYDFFIRYAPVNLGPDSASLSFTSNDPDTPSFGLTLDGNGIPAGQGELDDPDGDGVVNMIEDAVGTPRNTPSAAPGNFLIQGATAYFTFTRNINSTASFIVETASTPEEFHGTWLQPPGFTSMPVDLNGDIETILVSWPAPSTPVYFARLRVSK
jgi:Abnormal spindle-like microcephaly-assoc'd, ASPM-SPD-2-Hydin